MAKGSNRTPIIGDKNVPLKDQLAQTLTDQTIAGDDTILTEEELQALKDANGIDESNQSTLELEGSEQGAGDEGETSPSDDTTDEQAPNTEAQEASDEPTPGEGEASTDTADVDVAADESVSGEATDQQSNEAADNPAATEVAQSDIADQAADPAPQEPAIEPAVSEQAPQEEQHEDVAPTPSGRYADVLLGNTGSLIKPVINPDIVCQQGFLPQDRATAPEGDQSAEEPVEQVEPESFASTSEPTNIAEKLAEGTEKSTSALRAKYADHLPVDALAAWDYETLYLYDTKRAMPMKTARGEWPVDVRRNRNLKTWSTGALLDWMEGKIAVTGGIDEDVIFAEIYRRNGLPGNWTHEDAVKFILEGVKPDYTVNGVLVNDRSRSAKPLEHWTHLELRSALLDEIESKFSKDDLVVSLRKRLGLNDTYSVNRLMQTLAEASTEANMDNTLLKSKLQEFLDTMSKGQHLTDGTAGKAHKMMWDTIRGVMQRDYAEFHEGWCILLDFINENYNKVFFPERARKGWAQIALSKGALATYEDLLTLMIATRDPATRMREAKPFILAQILRYVSSESERNNVVHFYNPEAQ